MNTVLIPPLLLLFWFFPPAFSISAFSRSPPISGFLDDYTFVICGLLDLYEATLQTEWLRWAEELQLRQDGLFWDDQGSGYFCSDPNDNTVLLQLKEGEGWMHQCLNSYHQSRSWNKNVSRIYIAYSDMKVRIYIFSSSSSLLEQHCFSTLSAWVSIKWWPVSQACQAN